MIVSKKHGAKDNTSVRCFLTEDGILMG